MSLACLSGVLMHLPRCSHASSAAFCCIPPASVVKRATSWRMIHKFSALCGSDFKRRNGEEPPVTGSSQARSQSPDNLIQHYCPLALLFLLRLLSARSGSGLRSFQCDLASLPRRQTLGARQASPTTERNCSRVFPWRIHRADGITLAARVNAAFALLVDTNSP